LFAAGGCRQRKVKVFNAHGTALDHVQACRAEQADNHGELDMPVMLMKACEKTSLLPSSSEAPYTLAQVTNEGALAEIAAPRVSPGN